MHTRIAMSPDLFPLFRIFKIKMYSDLRKQ